MRLFRLTKIYFIPLLYLGAASATALGLEMPRTGRISTDGTTVEREIRYCPSSGPSAVLDLAIPKPEGRRRPAIVIIHGGGWIEGDKSSFSTPEVDTPGNIFEFARLGFVAAAINYRLTGIAPYPAALEDCRTAVRWLRAQADKYQIDPDRIGAWGNSAGGHLALLLALDPPSDRPRPFEEYSSGVQAAASDSGPIDLVYNYEQNQLRTVVDKLLGGPPDASRRELYRRASPISHISANAVPLLLIYGEMDEQVDVKTADRFVEEMGRRGARDLTYLRLAAVGHCPHSLARIPTARAIVSDFFVRILKPGT